MGSKPKVILPNRRKIGEALRRFWKGAGFSQETLAEQAQLNPKYVGEVERGEKIISIEALLRIAAAVRMPVAEFFREPRFPRRFCATGRERDRVGKINVANLLLAFAGQTLETLCQSKLEF